MEEKHLEPELLSIKRYYHRPKKRLEKQFSQLLLLYQVFVKHIIGSGPMERE